MPRSYASQFRAMVVEQVRNGRRVAEVARSVEVPEGTVFRWVRQDKIDRGEIPGTSSQESTELRAARRRIAELEAELATVKRASELFAQGQVVRPKVLCPIVETLAGEGHGTKRACRILGVPFTTFYYSEESSGDGTCDPQSVADRRDPPDPRRLAPDLWNAAHQGRAG